MAVTVIAALSISGLRRVRGGIPAGRPAPTRLRHGRPLRAVAGVVGGLVIAGAPPPIVGAKDAGAGGRVPVIERAPVIDRERAPDQQVLTRVHTVVPLGRPGRVRAALASAGVV